MVGWFPLLRGDKGVCYGERRGKGWDILRSWAWCCEEVSVGFGWLLWFSGSHAQTSHTPRPSQEGRFGCCLFVWQWVDYGVVDSPLERGLRGVLWWEARQGLRCCEILFREWWPSNTKSWIIGYFCNDVTRRVFVEYKGCAFLGIAFVTRWIFLIIAIFWMEKRVWYVLVFKI